MAHERGTLGTGAATSQHMDWGEEPQGADSRVHADGSVASEPAGDNGREPGTAARVQRRACGQAVDVPGAEVRWKNVVGVATAGAKRTITAAGAERHHGPGSGADDSLSSSSAPPTTAGVSLTCPSPCSTKTVVGGPSAAFGRWSGRADGGETGKELVEGTASFDWLLFP